MAQWNITTQDYLNQERSLFEVYNVATKDGQEVDQYNRFPVSFHPTQYDAFNRLRTSNPLTLFDSSHRYRDNNLWTQLVVGSGSTVGFVTTQGLVDLTVGVGSTASIQRESIKTFAYQPGKSLQIMNTFVMNAPKTNLVQRVGY